MTPRTKRADLERVARYINHMLTTHDYDICVAVWGSTNRYALHTERISAPGAERVGPFLPMKQALDWMTAFAKGLEIGLARPREMKP